MALMLRAKVKTLRTLAPTELPPYDPAIGSPTYPQLRRHHGYKPTTATTGPDNTARSATDSKGGD